MRHFGFTATTLALVLGAVAPVAAQPLSDASVPSSGVEPPGVAAESLPTATETVCEGGIDEDRDGLADCADADCFDAPRCHAGGREERTEAACSDWIDNDGDGAVDCDDSECRSASIRACRGSWPETQISGGQPSPLDDELPELGEGQTIEDLIGRGGDANGERTDETCSDGIDNDFDGRVDCADFGCRFDPQVSACQGQPGLRFSVVAGVGTSLQWNYDQPSGGTERVEFEPTVGFTLLQLRALGPIPFIENSFFLINVRAEDRVRLTFLLFQVPLDGRGRYIQLNSGFGGLSSALILSAARQPLLDPPFPLYSRFEQGNGAALEIGGPIDDRNVFRFRVFAAGGSGEFSGSVGGGFFRSEERNFSWALGGQLHLNLYGHYDRFDNVIPYVPDPGTVAVLVGGKYDQRAAERFIGLNTTAVLQYWHFTLRAESYSALILDDPMTIPFQTGFNVMLCALLAKRLFVLCGDATGYYQPIDYSMGPPNDPTFRNQRETFMWRTAFHWYVFRNTGMLSVMYREQYNEMDPNPRRFETERQLRLEARFRF
jgi:hypothetical protein